MNKQELVREYLNLVQDREKWIEISNENDVLTNDFNRRIQGTARKLEDFLDDVEFFNLTGRTKNPLFSYILSFTLLADIGNVFAYEICTDTNKKLVVTYDLVTNTLFVQDGKIDLTLYLTVSESKVIYDFLQSVMALV